MLIRPHSRRLSSNSEGLPPTCVETLPSTSAFTTGRLPTSCGAYPLTHAAELPLHISSFPRAHLPPQLADQPSQIHQVPGAEEGTVSAPDDLWIGSHQIGPLQRNGANGAILDLQE